MSKHLTMSDLTSFHQRALEAYQNFTDPALDSLDPDQAESIKHRVNLVGQKAFEVLLAGCQLQQFVAAKLNVKATDLTPTLSSVAYLLDKKLSLSEDITMDLETQIVVCKVAKQVLPTLRTHPIRNIRTLIAQASDEDLAVIALGTASIEKEPEGRS